MFFIFYFFLQLWESKLLQQTSAGTMEQYDAYPPADAMAAYAQHPMYHQQQQQQLAAASSALASLSSPARGGIPPQHAAALAAADEAGRPQQFMVKLTSLFAAISSHSYSFLCGADESGCYGDARPHAALVGGLPAAA